MVTRGVRFGFRRRLFLPALVSGTALAAVFFVSHQPAATLQVGADRTAIPAGGVSARITVSSTIPMPDSGFEAKVTEGSHSARIARTWFEDGSWNLTVQSKTLPGVVAVAISLPPFAPVSAKITVVANRLDSVGDGTPDVLRLHNAADQAAFRSWFTYLAEAQFFRETSTLPAEVSDCAGLIRYAYREALRQHDTAWAKRSGLPFVPAIASVREYEYPFTPWGAALFRIGPGTDAVAEFADAGTLLRYNTHFVSRDLRQALPGDLIFFHQADAAMPFHSMIFLGPSQIEKDAGPFLIYHTGPSAGKAGEVRRPAVRELHQHPDPAWHPNAENTHYLGVYRWNILWI